MDVNKELIGKGKEVVKDFNDSQEFQVEKAMVPATKEECDALNRQFKIEEIQAMIKQIELKIDAKIDSVSKDQAGTLDAIKELTKTVGELVSGWDKWRKAGKF